MNNTFGYYRHIAEELALNYAAQNSLSQTDVCMDELTESFLEFAQAHYGNA